MANIERKPTYDRSHYSFTTPSAQASRTIIERADPSGPADTVATSNASEDYFDPNLAGTTQNTTAESVEQHQQEAHPGLPRRSTFNYKQEAEEYKKALGEDDNITSGGIGAAGEGEGDNGGRRGSVMSEPFKPSVSRMKSWDYRDKRGQMQMSLMEEIAGSGQGYSQQ